MAPTPRWSGSASLTSGAWRRNSSAPASGATCGAWSAADANVSVFDVADHARLHEVLSTLPLFPWMAIQVTPLTTHPSALSPG